MELFNLLSDAQIWLYGNTFDVALDWIGELIRLLITGVGSVGVGIILFSVILRILVLPFDVKQRITMRKQNLQMAENKEQMEKLQKQYANDKDTYNKKISEMYKKNGMGACSSCLPMILSMVIFFVAIGAFNAFSQYSNISNYNLMVKAYNDKISEYTVTDINAQTVEDSGFSVLREDGKTDWYVRVEDSAADKYIYYTVYYGTDSEVQDYKANDYEYLKNKNNADKLFYVNTQKVWADRAKFAGLEEKVNAAMLAQEDDSKDEQAKADAIGAYFLEMAQKAVVEVYNTNVVNNTSFLWIKNIWVTDASYKTPVMNYTDFKTEVSRESFYVAGNKVSFNDIGNHTNAYTDRAYERVTGALTEAKSAPNGFFILIVLSIGTILLQQFVSMRSQKEQQKYGTVDGQGASQQKMMMIVMTGMFAIFSFMYSSAFSIYMIMSNVLSMGSTVIINKIVDANEHKKERAEIIDKYERRSHENRTQRTSNRGAKRK